MEFTWWMKVELIGSVVVPAGFAIVTLYRMSVNHAKAMGRDWWEM